MKSGFVAVIGRPNVGKSTLINAILGTKISIVTDKSQTTRNNIKGIYTTDDVQIIFVDTPGIHKPFQRLGQEMNAMAYSASKDVDAVILVIDSGQIFGSGDEFVIEHIDVSVPLFLVFNKIDTTDVIKIDKLKTKYKEIYPQAKIIETVAIEKFNIDELLNQIIDVLPEGPLYYPDDQLSDRDMRFQAKEIIREKTLLLLDKEVPHCLAVEIDSYKEQKKQIEIHASIIVEKPSQKGIVIGKNGQMIKKIGTLARKDIEKIENTHVILNLYVKVESDWRNKNSLLKSFGYLKQKN